MVKVFLVDLWRKRALARIALNQLNLNDRLLIVIVRIITASNATGTRDLGLIHAA
jgi:hypothetical protein